MTIDHLDRDHRQVVEIITALGFGVIERLLIREGSPCCDPAPHVIQMIKLDPIQRASPKRTGFKKEFQELFEQLNRVTVGIVDIEVRHGPPFRLIVEWSSTTFLETLRSNSEERL
jgi:hypothetical protein